MAETKKRSVFETLSAINCNEHTETIDPRNGGPKLTYLSWAWAWHYVKKNYPDATYTIYKNADGLLYHTDGRTAWVETGVTIEGVELIECLPIMDYKNKSIPVNQLTSTDVNKSVQRSLTKACARHGLGLYIYAGEDLPMASDDENRKAVNASIDGCSNRHNPAPSAATQQKPYEPVDDDLYKKLVRKAAEGAAAKQGGTIRDWWIMKTHPGQKELDKFDIDVEDEKEVIRQEVAKAAEAERDRQKKQESFNNAYLKPEEIDERIAANYRRQKDGSVEINTGVLDAFDNK